MIPSPYIAFDSRNNIVAHGNNIASVEDNSIVKGILSPWIMLKSLINLESFDKPIGYYPDTNAFDRNDLISLDFKKNIIEKVMFP